MSRIWRVGRRQMVVVVSWSYVTWLLRGVWDRQWPSVREEARLAPLLGFGWPRRVRAIWCDEPERESRRWVMPIGPVRIFIVRAA